MRLLFFLLFFLFVHWAFAQNAELETGFFEDDRDSSEYRWVKMKDGKIWMAENLQFKMDSSFCYLNQDSFCQKYGRLYTWEAAILACPKGWHLPSDQEWWDMLEPLGKASNTWGGQEKTGSADSGKEAFEKLDQSLFLPSLGGGMRRNKLIRMIGIDFINEQFVYFWTADTAGSDDQKAWQYGVHPEYKTVYRTMGWKVFALSCRCIKDEN